MKRNVLYLPSTPLNLLVSVAHAVHFSDRQRARLVLIDQKSTRDNVYLDALQQWEASPFEQVAITSGQARGWKKRRERQRNFEKLAELVTDFPLDAIAVGSDRRIEFQYMMQAGQRANPKLEGWYLDDGLYSYAGRPYHRIKDGLNSLIKKGAYGVWWREPETVGASSWICQAWLFRPQQAVAALKKKALHQIGPDWFLVPRVRDFSRQVAAAFGLQNHSLASLQKTDLILLIPHPHNIEKMPGYRERIARFLSQVRQQGKNVAVKYHPRTEGMDPLNLQTRFDALLLPASLAFEFILPFLPNHARVVGDVGTATLTTKWLRPELQASAVLSDRNAFERRFREVVQNLGVEVLGDFRSLSEGGAGDSA